MSTEVKYHRGSLCLCCQCLEPFVDLFHSGIMVLPDGSIARIHRIDSSVFVQSLPPLFVEGRLVQPREPGLTVVIHIDRPLEALVVRIRVDWLTTCSGWSDDLLRRLWRGLHDRHYRWGRSRWLRFFADI